MNVLDKSEQFLRNFLIKQETIDYQTIERILNFYVKFTRFLINIVKFIAFTYLLLNIVKPKIGFENTIIILLLGIAITLGSRKDNL